MNHVFLPYLLMIALINSCIELEISAPSFPDIVTHFHVSDAIMGLTITYNLLGFCLASLIYGPLSDAFGRRNIMIAGNGILTLGAFACVVAPSIEWLLIARFIQGIGAATSAVVVSAIIADVYTPERATPLYGRMNAVFSSLMALSPVMGGFINAAVGWRGNYGFVAVICVLSWVLLLIFLPETKIVREKINLRKMTKDYGVLASSVPFLSAATVPSLLYGTYMAFVAVAPFMYMQAFGLSLLIYTLHQGAIVAVFAITSIIVGKIITVLGRKISIYVSLSISLISGALIMIADSPYTLTMAMSLSSIGSAILYTIIFPMSLDLFPSIKGTASSAIMSLRYLLCSGLTGIATYVYNDCIFMVGIVIFVTAAIIAVLTLFCIKDLNRE
ncbi:MAG: MFS transporter [Alphaproteobacteria bacterium]|nr:MFS transporter [Alphaproteobacteria bacterium]